MPDGGSTTMEAAEVHTVKRRQGLKRSRLKPASDKKLAEIEARPEIREAVFARDGGCIARHFSLGTCFGRWEADEIVPRSGGGDPLDIDDIQTLCLRHHAIKTHHEVKAAARLGLYGVERQHRTLNLEIGVSIRWQLMEALEAWLLASDNEVLCSLAQAWDATTQVIILHNARSATKWDEESQ